MVAISVGDEYLAEALACHKFHDLLHAFRIQLVEDVVQEQKGRGAAPCLAEEIELSQFQGNEKGLALAL